MVTPDAQPRPCPRRRLLNPQWGLLLLQCLALPLYWWLGRELLGLGRTAAALFAAAAPFLTHAAGLGVGFLVSWRNRHESPGRSRDRCRDWLVAFLGEIGVSIRQFYWLMPFREHFRVPDPRPPVHPPPILLLHGYGCNRGLWLPAARWLAARGHVVRAVNLEPLHASIDRYAATIAAAVATLRADTGAAEVAIVAHSMGGLAARAYLRHCGRTGTAPGLAALVTLGTPHRGTHIACLGLGENARQMRFGAAWTALLLDDEAAAGAPFADMALRRRITVIRSLQDNIVSRPREQCLPGVRTITVRRLGHMSLATSPRILAIIERLLSRAA